jgi:hypothetical protein
VSEYYQKLDFPHFDYAIGEAAPWPKLRLRGPVPDLDRDFVAFVGAAQTFGRFVRDPFPNQVARALGVGCLNLGVGGVGPGHWAKPAMVQGLRAARLVVVQVMSGRSAGNSLFDNSQTGDLKGRCVRTGEVIRYEQFLERLVAEGDVAVLQRVVAETRDDYVRQMQALGEALRGVPTVLLWISRRQPAYEPDWRSSFGIQRHFPQLIDDLVLDRIRPAFGAFVACVSECGIPQPLWSATEALDGADLGADGLLRNSYYPSPEMHDEAARLLVPVCRRLLEH